MNRANREQLLDDVLRVYTRAVVLADPSRLEVWEDLGLTMSQLRVLMILSGDAGMTAGRLAERLGVRPSTVTGIVDRLVRQDLVIRQADTEDRRVVRNYLTQRGTEVSTDISRAGRTYLTRILDKLTDQQLAQLQSALEGITITAEEMGLLLPAPPPAMAETP